MPHQELFDKDGNKVRSVTEVLSLINKPGLNNWMARLGYKKANAISIKSRNFGTKFHVAIEETLLGKQLSTRDKKIQKLLNNFKQWRESNNVECLAIEQHLYSPDLRLHGTPDLVALVNGTPMIVDWKTSKTIYHEAILQPVGYALLWNETKIEPLPYINDALILQFDKTTGSIIEHSYTDISKLKTVFLHLLDAHDFLHKRGDYQWLQKKKAV